jgi:Na+/H+-translocating membrane pyrophosphatase
LLARKRGLATAAITAGTSVGSQYLFKTGMFASEPNPVTTVIDPGRQEMNVDVSGQQFDLSKAELIDGNLVYTQSQNIFSNLGKGDVVELYVGAGTDGTTIRGAE